MAHFAELNENNVVTRVVVISNEDLLDQNGNESEELGVGVCRDIFGLNTRWIQTSYNNNFRHRYAGTGMIYSEEFDAFLPRKPFASWTISEDLNSWLPPTPKPEIGEWVWNEATLSWDEVQTEDGVS